MKKLFLVFIILALIAPAEADVLVYGERYKVREIEVDPNTRQGEFNKEPARAYRILEQVDANTMANWTIRLWKDKNPSGQTQKYCQAEPQSTWDFVEVNIGENLMWVINYADETARVLLAGNAKQNKILGCATPSKLDGVILTDDYDDSGGEILNVKTSFRLNTKMTVACMGLTAEEAVDYILGYLDGKGYIDCQSNPCLCNAEWMVEPSMLIARDQFAGGVIDGKIYVFGGNGNPGGINLKSTEMYNPGTGVWTMRADNEHNGGWGVEELTSAVVDGNLYVFGAWGGGSSGVINFNEKYNPADNHWTTLAERPRTATAGPAVAYNGKIYVFGGFFLNGDETVRIQYDQVDCYDPAADSWDPAVTTLPKTMSNFAVAVIGTKAYLFGGAEGNEPPDVELLDDVITYDFEDDVWDTNTALHLPVKKAYGYWGESPVIDGKVYLIGGIDQKDRKFGPDKRVDIYNTATGDWEKGPYLPRPLESHVALALGTKIYVLGGSHTLTPGNISLDEVISLDTESCSP